MITGSAVRCGDGVAGVRMGHKRGDFVWRVDREEGMCETSYGSSSIQPRLRGRPAGWGDVFGTNTTGAVRFQSGQLAGSLPCHALSPTWTRVEEAPHYCAGEIVVILLGKCNFRPAEHCTLDCRLRDRMCLSRRDAWARVMAYAVVLWREISSV